MKRYIVLFCGLLPCLAQAQTLSPAPGVSRFGDTLSGLYTGGDWRGDISNATASSASILRSTLGLGTSATVNTGTSGATIPLLNGNKTDSGSNAFTNLNVFGPTSISGVNAAFTSAAASSSFVVVPSGSINITSPITTTSAAWLISPNATFTDITQFNTHRGYWIDSGNGANIWRFTDRVLVGGAVDTNGKLNETNRTWVGVSAGGLMTYFDTRSQMNVWATNGFMGLATASRTSDRPASPSTGATIGYGTFIANDNATTVYPAWGGYWHGYRVTGSGSLSMLEMEIANLGSDSPFINAHTSAGGNSGSAFGLQIGSGGEASNSVTSYPASAALYIQANGNQFANGIVIPPGAISGYTLALTAGGTTTIRPAMALGQGSDLVWSYSGAPNAIAGMIRSTGSAGASQSHIVFETGALAVYGVASDLATELPAFKLGMPTNGADAYIAMVPSQSGAAIQLHPSVSNGSFPNVGIALASAGTGVISLSGSAGALVNVGGGTPQAPVSGTALQVSGAAASSSIILNDSYAAAAFLIGRRAGGNNASPSALAINDLITAFAAEGRDTSAYSSIQARININAAEAWTSSAHGTYMDFLTTPAGSTTDTQALRINSTGNILVNTTTDNGSDRLQVNGSVKVATTLNAVTAVQVNGVAILPSLSGTTSSIGGGALLAGACTSGTVSITGATTAMVAVASPVTYPGDGSDWEAYVSSANTATVKVCAVVAVTPTSSTYNVRVLQ